MKTILCAVDLSSGARNAVDGANAMAREHGAQLILLGVVEPPEVVEGEFGMPPPPAEPSDEELHARLLALMPDEISAGVQTLVAHGRPAEEILRAANETHCDLIVMGPHHDEGWVSNFFHANVIDEVRGAAPCDVMAVESSPTTTHAAL